VSYVWPALSLDPPWVARSECILDAGPSAAGSRSTPERAFASASPASQRRWGVVSLATKGAWS